MSLGADLDGCGKSRLVRNSFDCTLFCFFRCHFISSALMSPIPLQNTTHTSVPPDGFFKISCSLLVVYPYLFVALDYPAFSPLFYGTTHTTHTSTPPVGFEPTTPATDRPLISALDHSATGIQTRNPIRRAATGLRPSPCSHRNRLGFPDLAARSGSLYRLSYPGP